MKGVRERIKNSNNRAYSLGTNFIADISRGHLMVIEKITDLKIAPEPLHIGDDVCAKTNKKILITAHILWGQIFLQILVEAHLLVIEK